MKNSKLWVVILEDRPSDSQRLESFIQKYASEKELQVEVSIFSEGSKLIEEYDNRFDVLFVDIELPGISGMKTAEKVREKDSVIPIIFTTNMAQYAVQGYEVAALGFMLKPIPYFQFEKYFSKAVAKCKKNRELLETSMLSLGNNRMFKYVSVDEIVYIIKDRNYIEYHFVNHEFFRERGTFRDVLPKFEKTSIKQISSGCMVNLRYVQKKNVNDVYVMDMVFSVTMPYRKSFTQDLMDYMRGV